MEASFYPDIEGVTTKWVKCRTCNGTGILYVPEEDYYVEEIEEKPKSTEESVENEG